MSAKTILVAPLLCGLAFAQLPASGTLSQKDQAAFSSELMRLDQALASSSDKLTVAYAIARTFAAGKQWPEAIDWLKKVATSGFDPSLDPSFSDISATSEFQAIVAQAQAASPAVIHSTRAFEIAEGDLKPESIAYDAKRKQFYVGSMSKGKIVRCSAAGACSTFAENLGEVLGLKIRADGLWAISNRPEESALLHFDLAKGAQLGKFAISNPGHTFNDLAFTPEDDVYVTDTAAGVVYHLASGQTRLTQLRHPFDSANGIATSPDGRILFVASFGDGISVMDLETRAVTPLLHSPDLCLGLIDGLYFYKNSLIAIQNGFMTPRVVRLTLSKDMKSVEKFEVLERRNPVFEGITTGVIVGNEFFFVGNVQDGKKADFKPLLVLKLRI